MEKGELASLGLLEAAILQEVAELEDLDKRLSEAKEGDEEGEEIARRVSPESFSYGLKRIYAILHNVVHHIAKLHPPVEVPIVEEKIEEEVKEDEV